MRLICGGWGFGGRILVVGLWDWFFWGWDLLEYGQRPPPLKFGTCSWKYDAWRGIVYSDAPKLNYLAEYARRFDCVEVDQWFAADAQA